MEGPNWTLNHPRYLIPAWTAGLYRWQLDLAAPLLNGIALPTEITLAVLKTLSGNLKNANRECGEYT